MDTLTIAKELRGAGFSQQQAEVQAEVISKAIDDRNSELATKSDFRNIISEIKKIEWMLGFVVVAGGAALGYVISIINVIVSKL